jgi:hypothetical protein
LNGLDTMLSKLLHHVEQTWHQVECTWYQVERT